MNDDRHTLGNLVPSPDAALGDGDSAARCPYLLNFTSANAVISVAAGILHASASSQ